MKKVLRIVVICFIILVVGYVAMLSIDRSRVFSNKKPIFNLSEEIKDYEEYSVRTYYGIGYRTEIKKSQYAESITMYLGNKVLAGVINDLEIEEIEDIIDLENYGKDFEVKFEARKDLGIEEICKSNDGLYSIKTFGGDVYITTDDGVIYRLEEAIKNEIIVPDDILEKAQRDCENEICQFNSYNDGGSTEYYYDNFTILKLNTLDGDNDLIIGMKGQILDIYNKNK